MRLIEAAISAPGSSGIVICGAAGVGKSRIAREALSAAASQGCETRWAVGTSSARAIPLGAFTAWAPSGVTDTVQLVRGVIESLTAASPGATVVVGVDDVHLLDDLSTFVVHQIVQRGAAKVVLTVRDGEPIPAGIQELWKVGQFDRLDLQPLSPDETTTLLSATLDGSVDSRRRSAAVEADPRQRSVSAQHRRAGGRRRPAREAARVLAVDRRSDHAARPGRADRIPHRSPARRQSAT